MKRLPSRRVLLAAPELAEIAILDLALKVVARALRAQHATARVEFDPSEPATITAARTLAQRCDVLRTTIAHYRRSVLSACRPAADDVFPF
jgi:hypothetical protein